VTTPPAAITANSWLFAALRAIVAVLVGAAIGVQLHVSIGYWHDAGVKDVTVNIVNFFSFFTIDSNTLTVAVCAIGAVLLAVRGPRSPGWFEMLRAAAVTYMVVTGIVYNLLLRGIELPQGSTVPWSNEVLHVVAPAYLVVDWLLAPGRRRLGLRAIAYLLIFPVVWVVYTLVRGPHVTDLVAHLPYWYPYPFLNPHTSGGYGSVAVYIVIIAVGIAAVATGVVYASRLGGRSPADRIVRR